MQKGYANLFPKQYHVHRLRSKSSTGAYNVRGLHCFQTDVQSQSMTNLHLWGATAQGPTSQEPTELHEVRLGFRDQGKNKKKKNMKKTKKEE